MSTENKIPKRKYKRVNNRSKETCYKTYSGMIARCENPNHPQFKRYGGRGIKICKEWREDYECFSDWAHSNGYKYGLQLDRIENNGDYEPLNCRFVTAERNSQNRSTTIFLEIAGIKKSLSDWSKITGIYYETVRFRYNSGYSPIEVIRPVNKLCEKQKEVIRDLYYVKKMTKKAIKERYKLQHPTLNRILSK